MHIELDWVLNGRKIPLKSSSDSVLDSMAHVWVVY